MFFLFCIFDDTKSIYYVSWVRLEKHLAQMTHAAASWGDKLCSSAQLLFYFFCSLRDNCVFTHTHTHIQAAPFGNVCNFWVFYFHASMPAKFLAIFGYFPLTNRAPQMSELSCKKRILHIVFNVLCWYSTELNVLSISTFFFMFFFFNGQQLPKKEEGTKQYKYLQSSCLTAEKAKLTQRCQPLSALQLKLCASLTWFSFTCMLIALWPISSAVTKTENNNKNKHTKLEREKESRTRTAAAQWSLRRCSCCRQTACN